MKNVNLQLQLHDDYGLAIVLIPPRKARLREPIDVTGEEVPPSLPPSKSEAA